jgi:uncharacterized protein (DUF1800 family)
MFSTRIALQFVLLTVLTASSALAGQIVVYSSGNLPIGKSKKLTAYVPLAVNTVNWSVNGVIGGNSTFGTVSASGLYQAPATVPADNAVSVRATSTVDPTNFGSVTITITQPPAQLWSISPASVPVGQFTIRANGSNFGPNSVVNFGGIPLATTFLSSTRVRATGVATVSQVGTQIPITVTNTGNGATTSPAVNLTIEAAQPVTVSVTPANATVAVSTTRQFDASVTGAMNTAVIWSVNGVAGGNSTVGMISMSGLYSAPATVPDPASVTIQATSVENTSSTATAAVIIQPPPPPPVIVTVTPATSTLAPAATQQFSAVVTGSADTGVTWSVNGIAGGNATAGTISTAGMYTAPAEIPSPANVTIRATSTASTSSSATAIASIVGPPDPGNGQGVANLSAARFLEQSSFGPTAADLAHVKQIGFDAWLTEQFAMAETQIADPSSNSNVRSQYLNRLSQAPDQLRQRVAYALSQIFVVSMNKNNYPNEIVPYLRILSQNAFGNYRTLLGEISVSSQMGKYLDLANSNKPGPGGGANENYARELMQLFTIGLYKLNPDGSPQLDAQGRPIPTYDQSDIQQVALALTGWTYPGPGNNNWEDFSGPMQPREVNHDMRQKAFLGCTLPANQTTTQDMNGVLDCLFNHSNAGPFVATRLIRSLVTSNPSPAYIQRIATVFNDNGGGVRGDLRAVVRAILTDAEARNDVALPTSGRLKDPIFHIVSFARALNGAISPDNGLSWLFSRMAQMPLTPPSVFSFYSPLYRIPNSPLFGPEFQIYTPTESVLRGNLLWEIVANPGSEFSISLSPFVSVAGNIPLLIDAVDQALFYGRMPQQMRQSLANAIVAQQDNNSRVQTALYLAALSGLYAVQY